MTALEPRGLDHTRLTIKQGPLVGPVLSRVVGIHAGRAPLPLDRLQDALLIADAIAARAPAYSVSEDLPVALRASDGRLELRIGPLREGGAAKVLEGTSVEGAGNVVERLADEIRVRPGSGGSEYLVVTITG